MKAGESNRSIAARSYTVTQQYRRRLWSRLVVTIVGLLAIAGIAGIVFVKAPPKLSEFKDYGTDMEGFLEAAKTCQKSQVIFTQALEFLRTNVTTTYFLRLNGIKDDKCELFEQILERETTPSTYTPPEMVERLKMADRSLIGSNKTCAYSLESLANKLQDLRTGTFSFSATFSFSNASINKSGGECAPM